MLVSTQILYLLEKVACGPFSDSGFGGGGKRRGFCRLRPATSDK
jgi:hypothetical protein